MDLITFIGLTGSIASIISLLRETGKGLVHPKLIIKEFASRAEEKGTPENQLIGQLEGDDLESTVNDLFEIYKSDEKFWRRITEKCLKPLDEAIDDYDISDTDLSDKQAEARRCVCRNISMARKNNGGLFPSERFKKLWEQFECEML
ncbi:MAG: hypothetical protein AAF478_10820 [Pseudomonadota bacterium]